MRPNTHTSTMATTDHAAAVSGVIVVGTLASPVEPPVIASRLEATMYTMLSRARVANPATRPVRRIRGIPRSAATAAAHTPPMTTATGAGN